MSIECSAVYFAIRAKKTANRIENRNQNLEKSRKPIGNNNNKEEWRRPCLSVSRAAVDVETKSPAGVLASLNRTRGGRASRVSPLLFSPFPKTRSHTDLTQLSGCLCLFHSTFQLLGAAAVDFFQPTSDTSRQHTGSKWHFRSAAHDDDDDDDDEIWKKNNPILFWNVELFIEMI